VVSATVETEEHEESIRFLSGAFHRAQTRRSTIEKEAFAIYWTVGRLDDLLGGIAFTIRTHHRNLLYLNNNGLRKVLQWKLDIQHYNAIIEHVPGALNVPTDVFSRLVVEDAPTTLSHIMVLTCSMEQRQIIQGHHEWMCARGANIRTTHTATSSRNDSKILAATKA